MSYKATLLYVEDDATLAFLTKENLEEAGYLVVHYGNGNEAISNFTSRKFDLCLLDIMLPRLDGFELARRIRKVDEAIPILFLTAKQAAEDKLQGFNLGGDDYITKPFNIEELKRKIEVFLKRRYIIETSTDKLNDKIALGTYTLMADNQVLIHGTNERHLTRREADLLKLFFLNPNQLLKREDILLKIWGNDEYFTGRSLDVFITRLRKYVKDDSNIRIENVHSMGFRMAYRQL